jgi:hypothetical protein
MVGFVPKPLLFISVLHAKPFDFLRGPLKLGMKYWVVPIAVHRLLV